MPKSSTHILSGFGMKICAPSVRVQASKVHQQCNQHEYWHQANAQDIFAQGVQRSEACDGQDIQVEVENLQEPHSAQSSAHPPLEEYGGPRL